MDRDFEKYRGGANEALSKRIHVTICRGSRIVLNKNVYEKMGKPEAVSLYYSRQRDMIGIEPTSPRLNDAFPLVAEGHGGYRINAAPFCRHFNIRVDTTLKFLDPELLGRELRLKLGHTICVARKRKKKNQ
jgi:hypothetical protein